MHQVETDIELNQSCADDLAESTRERDATHRQREFKSLKEVSRDAGFPMTVSLGQTFVTKPFMLLEKNWVH